MKWSCALHGALVLVAVILPLLPAFRPKEIILPVDFTVVLEANLTPPNVPPEQPPEQPAETPPERPPDAPPPVPLPEPPKNAVVVDMKKPEPEKKKEPEIKKTEPEKKKPEKKKEPEKPPEKKPFVKGKRIEAPVRQPQPKEDFTKLKPATTQPVTDAALSRDKIREMLDKGAKPGVRNTIPEDEMARCALLVKRAMYEAWEQPGAGDAGPRPTLLDIRLDLSGRVVSYRIRQSSGSAFFDQTVLKAAANAMPIRGLSVAFLKQYDTLTVEFKLE
jgi:protein TonB